MKISSFTTCLVERWVPTFLEILIPSLVILIASRKNQEALIKVKVEAKNQINPYSDVKVKLKAKNEQKLNFNYVKVKVVEDWLQPLNSQTFCKPKDEEEVGEYIIIVTVEWLYNFKYKKFLLYHWIQKLIVPSYGVSSSKKGDFWRLQPFGLWNTFQQLA